MIFYFFFVHEHTIFLTTVLNNCDQCVLSRTYKNLSILFGKETKLQHSLQVNSVMCFCTYLQVYLLLLIHCMLYCCIA